MKIILKISVLGLFYLTVLTSCEKDKDLILPFESVRIKQIINKSIECIDTISFEYNDNVLLIKGIHCGGAYFTNEYDNLDRLILSNSYNRAGLYHYFTFQYELNTITRMRYQYYPYADSWGGDNEKTVYCYNLQNNCERIEYYTKDDNGDWIKSDYVTLCFWNNDNLTELKHYAGDNVDYTETYQYDNKSNPEKLLNYMISPWTKSKNNPVSSSTLFSDGIETHTTFNYTYNNYGYPVNKDRIDVFGTHSEIYEYEFE